MAEGLVRLASLDLALLQRLGGLALDGRELGVDLVAVRVELIRVKRRDAKWVDYDLCVQSTRVEGINSSAQTSTMNEA